MTVSGAATQAPVNSLMKEADLPQKTKTQRVAKGGGGGT